jgi:hypothetical protein
MRNILVFSTGTLLFETVWRTSVAVTQTQHAVSINSGMSGIYAKHGIQKPVQ